MAAWMDFHWVELKAGQRATVRAGYLVASMAQTTVVPKVACAADLKVLQ